MTILKAAYPLTALKVKHAQSAILDLFLFYPIIRLALISLIKIWFMG